MKKIFLLILGFVMFKVGYSQYPIQQFIGADSAVVTSKGGLQGRFINVVFADTTAANSQRVRQYPGAMIYASGKLWVRNTTATAWNELAYNITPVNIYNSNGSLTSNRTLDGDGYSLTFDQIGGEFGVGADSINFNPASGKFRISTLNQGIGTRALRYNPVTKLITYSDTTSSVNIYNSDGTLTGNRELDGDGKNLSFVAVKNFIVDGDTANFLQDQNIGVFKAKAGTQEFILSDSLARFIRTNNAGVLINSTNGSARLILNPQGPVDEKKFEVVANNEEFWIAQVNDNETIRDTVLFVNNARNVGIGITNNVDSTLTVGGGIHSRGGLRIDNLPTSPGTKALRINANGVVSAIDTINNPGTVTSVGLSMPTAFAVANSPVTSSGTLTVTGAGVASQYIRGDGQLATLPTTGGGGSSVSYYLNGSVNQGTFAGTPYYEMSKTAIFGAGTDFNISSNGYIASFITDAGDPALLNIPAGNWDFEVYFQSSSTSGTPSFYVELYKYDGSTFTLIASSSANPEFITGGTSVDAYYTPLAVPITSLAVTDRLAVRIYVNNSGNTITLHTEDNNLCQIITTFSTGINALNGLTSQVQYFATGTSGTDFNINSLTDTHTFNLPTASATNRGALNSADWSTFNSKIGPSDTASMLSNYVTNAGYGLLKTTKTLSVDTLLISTRAWRQKGIDSVTSLINARPSGSGTTNYVSKWTSSSALGNSQIQDNGTGVGIGMGVGSSRLNVRGSIYSDDANGYYGVINATNGGWFISNQGNSAARISSTFTYFLSNTAIGTSTDAGYRLDVSGTARVREYLYMVRQDGAATIDALRYVTGGTIDIGTTFRVLGTNQWSANTGTTSYIQNNFGSKVFASQPNQNGNFTINDFQTTSLSPTIAAGYNQKVIGSSFTISSTAINNFFGLDIRATDNSSTIANNVYGVYADATLGTNTSANRWAGYFVGNGYFSGNVGIGTTSPSYLLDVNGTARVSGTELRLDNGTTGVINLYSNTPEIRFSVGDPTNYRIYRSSTNMIINSAGAIIQQIGGNQAYTIDASNGHILRSAISGGAALARLTTGGNLIVGGTTDSGYRVDVQGTARVSGTALFTGNIGGNNWNFDSGNVRWVFGSATNQSSRYFTLINIWSTTAATLAVRNIASQTANSLQIENSGGTVQSAFFSDGSLGIKTNVNAGYALDVNGTARVQSNISFGNLASNSYIYAEANGYLTQSMNFQIGGSSNLIGLFRGWGTSGSGTLGGINTASMVNIFSQSGPLMLYANSQNIYFATTTSSLFTLSHSNQNIGIGTTSPNASALLDVSSTTKGFLPPRMTNAQMVAISSPAAGLVVYDTTNNKLNVYDGTNWVTLH